MARVFVVDWQYECCGDPFAIGSVERWQVVAPDVEWLTDHLGKAEAATVTHTLEHHGDGVDSQVEGRVPRLFE